MAENLLVFPPVVCKLSLTEIKHIFKEDAIMLQISEIVKKARELRKRMPFGRQWFVL